jgi:hypothetical protein
MAAWRKKWDTVIPADLKRLFVSSIAHSIICTVRLFGGKMHSDWFNGIEIMQGRWQHGEEVGYCYPSRLEKTLLSSIAHSMICTRLFRGKMHSDWFNGIEILQGRWQHGKEVGHCYPSGLEKTLCKRDVYVPLVMKGLKSFPFFGVSCNEFCDSYKAREDILQFWLRKIRTYNFDKPSSSTDKSDRKQFIGQ